VQYEQAVVDEEQQCDSTEFAKNHRSDEVGKVMEREMERGSSASDRQQLYENKSSAELKRYIDEQIQRLLGPERAADRAMIQRPMDTIVERPWDSRGYLLLAESKQKQPSNDYRLSALPSHSNEYSRGSVHRLPGKQKKFIDNETERISNIMMGVFSRMT
jgi:hypothetical protein